MSDARLVDSPATDCLRPAAARGTLTLGGSVSFDPTGSSRSTVFDVLWVDVQPSPLGCAHRSLTTSRADFSRVLAGRRFDLVVAASDAPVPGWETGPPRG